jgi:hypothetical protein
MTNTKRNAVSWIARVGHKLSPVRSIVVAAYRPGESQERDMQEDIRRARLSYQSFWGQVPLWDVLDELETTFNYIAYVEYEDSAGEVVTEALSSRMVVLGGEDLDFYQVAGVPLSETLRSLLYEKRGFRPNPIAIDSRMGAIRPPNSTSNAHTLDAWAAIKLRMAFDARKLGVDYIAGQLRPELLRILTRDGVRFDHPPAEELLGLPRGSISLDRTKQLVIDHVLHYPGYFLSAQDLCRVVGECIETGLLTYAAYRSATGLASVDDLLNPRNGRFLVPVIWCDQPVGASLRQRLLEDVPDGTYFTISAVEDYARRASRVLEHGRHLEARTEQLAVWRHR